LRLGYPVLVAGGLVVTGLTFGRLLPPFDLLVFLKAGRQVLNGANPYAPVASAAFATGHAFVYPYVVAWLFVPLAVLPTNAATIVYAALSVAAIVLGGRLLSSRGIRASVLLLMCSTTIIGLQIGTLNALLVLGLAAAWRYRSRPWVSAVLVGLLAVAKLFLAPLIVWLVFSRRYRSAAIACGVLVTMLVVGWATGPLDARHYLSLLSTLRGNETVHSWSLTSLLRNLGLGATPAQFLAYGVAAMVLSASLVMRRRGADETAVYGTAVLASLLTSPIVWSSYLVLLAVPLLVGGATESVMIAFAIASWLLVTPDAASPTRVAIGAAIVVVVAVTPHLFHSHRQPFGRLLSVWWAGLAALCVGDALLVWLTPALSNPARTPFVVCADCPAVGVATFRSASRRRSPSEVAGTDSSRGDTEPSFLNAMHSLIVGGRR
jgi:alpha-1,2-mannosyltransferase